MQNQSNIIVEKTELQTHTGFGYELNIPHNYVIYFEKEQNKELNLYIRKNYEELKNKFASIELNLIYLPFLVNSVDNIENVLEYYLPQLNYYQISNEASKTYEEKMMSQFFSKGADDLLQIFDNDNFTQHSINSEELLNLVDYKGEINSGLLFFNIFSGTIGVSDFFYSNSSQNYELFFDDVLSYLKPEEVDFCLGDNMIANFLPILEPTEQLDDDAKEVIKELENRLNKLGFKAKTWSYCDDRHNPNSAYIRVCSREQIVNLMKSMYNNHQGFFLKRKYEKFLELERIICAGI